MAIVSNKTLNDQADYANSILKAAGSTASVQSGTNLKSTANKSNSYEEYKKSLIDKENYANRILKSVADNGVSETKKLTDQLNGYVDDGGGNGGNGGTTGSVNNEALKNILRQSYQNSLDYGQQQYENTLNAANDAYNSSARNVNAASDKALKEAYIQKMIAQRDMPQQLAALGLSGGASETMNARMNNNYANNRASIESDRLSALTELLDALNQQKYTAANNLAAQKAESLQDYYNQLISMAANGQDVSGMDASYTPTTTTQTKTTYADDADFQKQYAAVVSGQTSRQTLINNAAELMNYYGYDGFNTLLNASK